jgi:hypothetical protein
VRFFPFDRASGWTALSDYQHGILVPQARGSQRIVPGKGHGSWSLLIICTQAVGQVCRKQVDLLQLVQSNLFLTPDNSFVKLTIAEKEKNSGGLTTT